MRRALLALILAAVTLASCRDANDARAQNAPSRDASLPPNLMARSVTEDGAEQQYYVFIPRNFDAAKKWPIIIAVHGSVERGGTAEVATRSGLGIVVRAQSQTFPAIVLFPHIAPGASGVETGERAVMRELDATIREFNGDADRVYLTGLSFGGTFINTLAFRFPERFAALVPISAGICPRCLAEMSGAPRDDGLYSVFARRVRGLPTWIFQGQNDPTMPVVGARAIVAALRAENAPVRYTEYPGGAHNVWDRTYADPDMLAWMLSQRRKP